jgi:tetratricopeptide (TPR) repeat protein
VNHFRKTRLPDPRSVAALALSLWLGACATHRTDSVAPPNAPVAETGVTLTPIETAKQAATVAREQAQFQIMAGEMAAGRNQPDIAAHEFLGALDHYPDRALASRTTSLALAANDADLAEAAARRWLQIDPSAESAREVLARLALRRGAVDDTLAQCQAIVAANADGPGKGLLYVARLLNQAGNSAGDTALQVMDKLVAQWSSLADAHQAMGILALRFGKLELAEAAAHEAIRLDPKDPDHGFLLVGVLVRQNHLGDADHEMNQLLKAHPDKAADLRMSYARLLLESNQRDHAHAQLETLLKENPGNRNARYALGVMALDDQQLDRAEQLFKPLLKGSNGLDALYQMGRVEEARKNYTAALADYQGVTSGASAIDAAVRSAYVLAQLGRYDEAQELMQSLREQVPQLSERFYLTEGDLLTNVNQDKRALAVYNEALGQFPDDPDLLYGRSLIYERNGQIDLAEQDLRTIIAGNADDARALNALGYMLTVHTTHYDEAKKLIGRALELDPDDAAIMDSMGWVQYHLGDTADAHKLLQAAYAKFPDPEVAAHLGEVLWAQGDKAGARAVWAQALKKDPDQPTLRATIERLDKQ